ncbi:hypothetical protein Tco_1146816 [Tanacetum coccineum]
MADDGNSSKHGSHGFILILAFKAFYLINKRAVILVAQVVKYKESEVLFYEEIALLKRSVGHKDYLMGLVKTELEKVKEEKEGVEFKLAKFEKSSKDLDDLLASQVTDKSKKGFGYNAVPSPHPLILNRPTPLDLSYSGLEEFQQPEINWYGPRNSSSKPTTVCNKESNNLSETIDDSLISTTQGLLLAVLMKTGLKTVKNTKPLSTVRSVNTARPVSTVRARGFNAVKPSACWVWRPIKPNGASLSNSQLNEKGFVDSGCSRHMSWNTLLTLKDVKDLMEVLYFGGGAMGGRITGSPNLSCPDE